MKLLLHICCANCGLAAVEKLLPDFKLTLFWYNPNIHPVRGRSPLGDRTSLLRGSASNGVHPSIG
ncbi:epoxyqueuosine reductase QueH, partial [bacterium]|nr:epoxyqueuosine reductase QueH [bacterium]